MFNDLVTIIHHHIFKCAGSTFSGILQRNYPEKVLHIEGITANHRISCSDVRPFLEEKHYKAVSSHLLTMPQVGDELGLVHVIWVRNPIARVKSAYRFMKKEKKIAAGVSFIDWYKNLARWNDNFQSKHISIKSDMNRDAWISNPSTIDINRDRIFFASVEDFDISIVLLENWLSKKEINFDGAYPAMLNTSVNKGNEEQLDQDDASFLEKVNEEDIAIWLSVRKNVKAKYEQVDPDGILLENYKFRCALLKEDRSRAGISQPPPKKWIYIEHGSRSQT